MTTLSSLAAWWRGELDAPLPDWTITPDPLAGHRWACTHCAATGGHSQKDNTMTENTVPRVARFADLREGMTIERVCTHPSGSTVTYVGVVSKFTAHHARDDMHFWLVGSACDDHPRVTLRILADPVSRRTPAWGALVRVIGGKHDGKRAVVLGRDDGLCPWYAEDYGWVSADEIIDWEVIHDSNALTADPLDENDHRDRIDRYDHRIVRHGNKHWHTEMATCCGHCRDNALADWNAACGPLRFADEVTA